VRRMEPLNRYLRELPTVRWRPSFRDIEQIIGCDLPQSSRRYPAWWSNDPTPGRQSWAWLDAGFQTAELDLRRAEISFIRRGKAEARRPEARCMTNDSPEAPSLSRLTNQHPNEIEGYDVALVSCVKTKQQFACAARDLYISPRFQKSRTIAEKCANRWFILSALHGLVDPDEVISPYEYALKGAKIAERRKWAQEVFRAICLCVPVNSTIQDLITLEKSYRCSDSAVTSSSNRLRD
jgi:hypothetical protein